jgi:recombination protein RecT
VQRLTAPNPGVMTGPGTNSYLVGDPDTGYIAIDPGPADPAHLERCGAPRAATSATSCAPIRTPTTRPAPRRCRPVRAARPAAPPILGLPSAPTARAASEFRPTARCGMASDRAHGRQRHPHPAVLHTPGHAANHLCLVLEEDGLLFSGDHILNGSTTVSTRPTATWPTTSNRWTCWTRLRRARDRVHPARPRPCAGRRRAAIAALKAHRLAREAKVLAAMRARPEGTPEQWVELAYDDVPPRMWPVARRSLLAHVERIRALASA